MILGMIMILAMMLTVVGCCLGVFKTALRALFAFIGLALVLAAIWLLVCFIVTRFIDFDKDYIEYSGFYWFFTYSILELCRQCLRIKVHVSGMDNLPEEKFLLVCNHKACMDPLLTMEVLKKYHLGFVARREVCWIPIISRLMHRCYCPELNRDDLRESAKTIQKVSRLIKEDRASMGIYPEGTRNRGQELLPFMPGAFKVAKKAHCPVVVATLKNTEQIVKRAPFRKTDVYLDFVEILGVDFVDSHSTIQISDAVKKSMEKNLVNSSKM